MNFATIRKLMTQLKSGKPKKTIQVIINMWVGGGFCLVREQGFNKLRWKPAADGLK